MEEFVFQLRILATVRVLSERETLAREAVFSSILHSPSTDEIRLANESLLGRATIAAVDFSPQKNSLRLIADIEGDDLT
jgi:hypothetical protein